VRVAEIESGSEFTKINGKNVIKDISQYEFNHFASRGADSNYAQCRKAAERDFAQATTPAKTFQFEKGGEGNER
jgi:hypothetical protein